jgi:hypothetical protein
MVFAVALAILGVSAAAALAAPPSEFGGNGEGAGQFTNVVGISIFQETGDVYLVDNFDQRLESFTAEGAFRYAVGWGVLDGKSELERCTTVCRSGLEGAGAGQFARPRGAAVDNDPTSGSYGDIYVTDSENHRIEKFDASGRFLLTFGKEVNHNTKGDVCTSTESQNCGAGTAGSGPGEFSATAGGIAVDSAGTVYIGDAGRVERFSSTGVFLSEWSLGESLGLIPSLAVNASHEVYVVAEGLSGVHRYSETGIEQGLPFATENFAQSVAVGPSGQVYVDEQFDGLTKVPHIGEYSPTGARLKAFDIGSEGGSRGIAFGNGVGRLYVVNETAVRLVGVPPVGPFTAPGSELVVDAKPSHAEVKAFIDAEGSSTRYHFEYGLTEAYGETTPPAPLSEEGGLFAAVPVNADLTGLKPNTLYHFRTVTEDESGHMTFGPDAILTTTPPALISGESTTQLTPESARLNVEIDPQGAATSYHYEYGLSSAYEQSVPVPDAQAGEAEVSAAHSIAIEHLIAGKLYHYRVVATNAFGTEQGPDRTFITTTAPAGPVLPDGRVWEMVSPAKKNGASLEAISEEGGLIQASEQGDAMAYFGTGPLGAEAEPEGSQNIADSQFAAKRRAPGEWETRDITTPRERPTGFHPGRRSEYLFFSSDLSKALVEPLGESPLSPEATERTPYLRDVTGGYTPLVTPHNVPAGTKFGGHEVASGSADFIGGAALVGAAPDLGSAAITSPLALTSELTTPEAGELASLYRWSADTHALQLVSWLPATAQAPETPAAAAGESAYLGGESAVTRHAVSRNGERLIYETVVPTTTEHKLFLRDMTLRKSVQLDLNESGTPALGAGSRLFQDASEDGRVVFFTDSVRLTADATGGPGATGSTADLYRCEVQAVEGGLHCKLKNLTVPIGAGEASDVLGDVEADESGDRVYFVANGRLTADAVHGDCPTGNQLPAVTTSCNLYVYDAASDEVRLVAVLSGRDFPDWGAAEVANLKWLTSRVSPSGRYLVFMSQRSLTGYDNRDARSGSPDEEVYRYDFERAQLACVSCNASGARPNGVFDSGNFPGLLVDRPKIWGGQWLAAAVPGWTAVSGAARIVDAPYQSRYLSNDGRVFFNSVDNLVPADANGQFDVYEYEPEGIGSCGIQPGCVGLMSSGLDKGETAFLDAGTGGEDVFFLTAAKLSLKDTDTLNDVYDAHVCAAASDCPAAASGAPPPCETSDACRAAPSPQPDIFGAPSSSTFSGAGNLVPVSAVTIAKAKPLTRARLLANALNACHKDRAKNRRHSCERKARKRYGPPRKARKAGHPTTTRKGGK